MADNKPRRGSLLGLQILGRNSQRDYHAEKHIDNSPYGCIGLHPSQPEPSPASTGRPDSIRTGPDSYNYSYRNATPISTQSTRSLHLHDTDRDTDTDNQYLAPPNSRTRLLPSQTTRFSSCSSRLSTSSTMPLPYETTNPNPAQKSIHQNWSRLPTPSYHPPPDRGYSHEMYKREGRRGVFSSLGKKYSSLRRSLDRAGMNNKRVISDSALKISSVQSPGKMNSPAGSRVISSDETSSRGPSTMIPLPKSSLSPGSGSMLSIHSKTAAIETTTELEHGSSQSQSSDEYNTTSTQSHKKPTLRKVRIKLHHLQPQPHSQDDSLLYTPHRELSSTFSRIRDEMTPKKIWTQGLQSFKSREKGNWNYGTGSGEQAHHNHNGMVNWRRYTVNAESSQIPIPLSSSELRVCRGRRNRVRTERMV